MKKIAQKSPEELEELFRITANEMGVQPAVVEKDFWVCYMLDHLFHRSEFKDSVIFKGGTSLSKAYGLIERFSEDIDLILDWRLIGYGRNEPWDERSNTKQDKFKLETIERTDKFLSEVFTPSIKTSFSNEMGFEADIYTSFEEETVIFAYPQRFSSPATLDVIRLEIGPLAAWSPSRIATVTSYLAEQHSEIFEDASTDIPTAVPERTFWEKITILHQEANRPEDKQMPKRYSRHYYDVYQLGHSNVLDESLANTALLARVVEFKEKFYRTPWAKLPEAKPGTLKIVPQESRLKELRSDYASMQPMIFGEAPNFDVIIEYIQDLEASINDLELVVAK